MPSKFETKIAVIETIILGLNKDVAVLESKIISKESVLGLIDDIKIKISNIEKDLDDIKISYVSEKDFITVRNIVYGFVGLILIAVATALLKLLSL